MGNKCLAVLFVLTVLVALTTAQIGGGGSRVIEGVRDFVRDRVRNFGGDRGFLGGSSGSRRDSDSGSGGEGSYGRDRDRGSSGGRGFGRDRDSDRGSGGGRGFGRDSGFGGGRGSSGGQDYGRY